MSIILRMLICSVFLSAFAPVSVADDFPCGTHDGRKSVTVGDRCGDAVYIGMADGEHVYAEAVARGGKLTWAAATATCADLGASWRVPSRAELKLLFDSRDAAALAGMFDAGWYWSSSQATGLRASWALDAMSGEEGAASVGNRFATRCVRSGGGS